MTVGTQLQLKQELVLKISEVKFTKTNTQWLAGQQLYCPVPRCLSNLAAVCASISYPHINPDPNPKSYPNLVI